MSQYEQKRIEFLADMATLFEFFSYDIKPTLERFIEAARHIQAFDEYALVMLAASGELRVFLSEGLPPCEREQIELTDFYPGETALYIVDEVTDTTENIIFPRGGAIRSYAIVPLITQNDVIGLLLLGSTRVGAFEEEMQDLFFSLGSHLAVAMENIRHYERAQERLNVLISLQESHQSISSAIELDRILMKIADEGMKTLGLAAIAIYLRGETAESWERRVFRARVPSVPAPALLERERMPDAVVDALANSHITVLRDAEVEELGALRFSPRLNNVVVLPLRADDVTAGFALLESTTIDSEKQHLIQLFSGQVQVLFANAMLVKGLREKTDELERSQRLLREYADNIQKSHEMLENRVKELTTLHDVNVALVSKTELDEILNYILDQACIVMRADKGSLLLLEGDELQARCTRGIKEHAHIRFRLGEGVAGTVAMTGQPKIVENIMADSRYKVLVFDRPKREETMLAVPLMINNKVIGVLNVDRELKFGVFNPDEERLLVSLGNSCAQALEKARHFSDLRDLHLETLEAFAQAVDTKDAYTHGHSRRVSFLSVQVAQMLRLPQDEIEIIARAALLHDIGKIGISNAILFKPGRLTDEEYEIMKAHAVFGENIVKPIKRMATEAKIIRHHHERWDGKGYPDGLRGEQIPLASAIISVTDAYDTMASDRPYRRSLGKDAGLEELQRCSGSQFNPLVVGAFMMVASRRDFSVDTFKTILKAGTA
jgi:HD-GYP domain-containing protein (c-di-GMP phosphodiesterase class II)